MVGFHRQHTERGVDWASDPPRITRVLDRLDALERDGFLSEHAAVDTVDAWLQDEGDERGLRRMGVIVPEGGAEEFGLRDVAAWVLRRERRTIAQQRETLACYRDAVNEATRLLDGHGSRANRACELLWHIEDAD